MQHDERELAYFQEQSLDYKIAMSNERIKAWYESWCRFDIYDEKTGVSRFVTMDTRDNSVPNMSDSEYITGIKDGQVYVAFSGGADSTVLLDLVRKLYPDVEAVFCNTGLEYPEVQSFVKTFDNVTTIYPEMSFVDVIKKYGYPLISKEVSDTIHLGRQNIAEGKLTTRVQKLNGTYLTSQGKLSLFNCSKYKPLTEVDFIIGGECCDVMKKRPFKRYEKQTGKKAILGVMADDSRLRKTQWMKSGCNAFESKRPKSKPLSIWTTQDILQYIQKYNLPIASVYGEIVENPETHRLETTGCEHTGCIFCGFGAHLETRSRFLRLKQTHPIQYNFCMGGGCYDDNGLWIPVKGEGLGMAHIFDVCNGIYGDDFIKYKEG